MTEFATKEEVQAVQTDVTEIKELLSQGVPEMIALFNDVKSSMRVFVRIANGLKWVAGVVTALFAAWYAVIKFFRS